MLGDGAGGGETHGAADECPKRKVCFLLPLLSFWADVYGGLLEFWKLVDVREAAGLGADTPAVLGALKRKVLSPAFWFRLSSDCLCSPFLEDRDEFLETCASLSLSCCNS